MKTNVIVFWPIFYLVVESTVRKLLQAARINSERQRRAKLVNENLKTASEHGVLRIEVILVTFNLRIKKILMKINLTVNRGC